MRKAIALFSIFLVTLVLVSCSSFTFPFSITQLSYYTTTTTTRPNTADGTVTYIESNYDQYVAYDSPSYDLTIDAYNEQLIASRDLIRRSNIQISTTLYDEQNLIPWADSTIIRGVSQGSGVIFMEDELYYYALTNEHVIDDEGYFARYEVKTFSDTAFVSASVVASDAELDLAVIKFDKGSREEIHLIDYDTRAYTSFRSGELVLAVGNPLSLENNVTFGEFINMEAIEDYAYMIIYHNATINEGSSGGALVDIDANLIGLNTWGVEETDEQAFAVPIHIIYMFLVNNGIINN
ncbi:MAG: trypsin-like peptidase domain-containing protein [Bacilli bacterium]|nr:trypsin-like peptidase domain-containing protein [Bacilli bacterium]MBN2696705.1 trypsin-like peptidase domain-containing protein [Bacilli bacterium]